MSRVSSRGVFHFVSTFDYDKRKDGWKIISDTKDKAGDFIPKLVGFLKKGEDCIMGEEFLIRAIEMSDCAGQRQAEAMLRNQKDIPKDCRKHILVVAGTVWQNPQDGSRYVAYLYWGADNEWHLGFCLLKNDFRRNYRLILVRPR